MGKDNKIGEIIEKIREKGISLGLSDQEIDSSFLSSWNKWQLSSVNAHKSQNNQPKTSNFKKIVLILLFCAAVILILTSLAVYYEDICAFLIRFIGKHVLYPVMRLVRLAALPLITRVDMSSWHDEMCLIPNPYFVGDLMGCDVYDQASTIDTVDKIDAETFHRDYFEFMKSVHIQNSHKTVKLSDIQELYDRKQVLAHSGINIVTLSNGTSSDLNHLMNLKEEILELNESTHMEWIARGVGTYKFLTKIFPRPNFMKTTYEVSLEKIILFDSTTTKSYHLPRSHSPQVWYAQLSGARTLQISPREHCKEKVEIHKITLQPGDISYFHAPMWDVQSLPVRAETGNQELTISYMGSFMQ